MPDEDPLAPQPDAAPPRPDTEDLTAALLRRPEVGHEHADEPAAEPEAVADSVVEVEPAGEVEGPIPVEGPAWVEGPVWVVGPASVEDPTPVVPNRRVRPPSARARLIAVGIAGAAILALVAGTVLVIRPGAVATSSPTASATTALAAAAGDSATPSIDEPSATAQPSQPDESATPEPTEMLLAPDAGRIVFGDDFVDARGGWPTGTTALTKTSSGNGFYAITGKGNGTDHLVEAPFQPRIEQIAVTALATLASGRGTAGFGVTCGARTAATPADLSVTAPPEASPAAASPEASHQILFEFVVLNNGGWLVERRDGPPDRAVQPIVLLHGNTSLVPGARPLTVAGVCASSADGSRTRLIFAINGSTLIEFSDASATVTEGWHGGLVVSTVNATAGVVFRHFDVRDLAVGP